MYAASTNPSCSDVELCCCYFIVEFYVLYSPDRHECTWIIQIEDWRVSYGFGILDRMRQCLQCHQSLFCCLLDKVKIDEGVYCRYDAKLLPIIFLHSVCLGFDGQKSRSHVKLMSMALICVLVRRTFFLFAACLNTKPSTFRSIAWTEKLIKVNVKCTVLHCNYIQLMRPMTIKFLVSTV